MLQTCSCRIVLVLLLLGGCLVPAPAPGEDDWAKQFRETLKNQLQKALMERFIRFDKQKNTISFTPELLSMAAEKALKKGDGSLQNLVVKPEGKALNFSLLMRNGVSIAAGIEPEALELGPEEMAIVARLPQGMKIEGVDLRKTVSGFFDNLIGFSPGASASATGSPAPVLPVGNPTGTSSSFSAADFLKTFSVEGNSMRLKRPLKASSLGRILSSAMARSTTGKGSEVQRLALTMDGGWLSLNLGEYDPEKVLMEMGMEILVRQIQGRE